MSFKSGYITVVGVPNAGKSSLVNELVRESVSIVTAKPQTTRKRTLAIFTEPKKYQMIFIDTPGVIESDAGLNKFLRYELSEALKNVDVVIAAIAPWEFEKEELPWALKVHEGLGADPIFIATQDDKKQSDEAFKKKRVERWNHWMAQLKRPSPLLITSSTTGKGLSDLKTQILARLPEGPQYYETDLYTVQTMREMAAEIVRKYCFEFLHQEIPYGLAVLVNKFEEGEPYKIEADVIVLKESHKGMVVGRGGQMLKKIGTLARQKMEKTFEAKVFLKLHVVAKPHWLQDKNYLDELGYGTGSAK